MLLGLSAGLAPGPLTALVISHGMAGGSGAGVRVALAPLVTDLPIILVSVFALAGLAGASSLLGGISLAGAVMVFCMGIRQVRTEAAGYQVDAAAARLLVKGAMVNLLSPHPYLFWLGVGAPVITEAVRDAGVGAGAGFLSGFYLMLVGSKIFMAIGAAKCREMIGGRLHLAVMKILGLLLCLFAMVLMYKGLFLLGLF